MESFIVIVDGSVVFQSESFSAAFAYRDEFGHGTVAEVLSEVQENPATNRVSEKSPIAVSAAAK